MLLVKSSVRSRKLVCSWLVSTVMFKPKSLKMCSRSLRALSFSRPDLVHRHGIDQCRTRTDLSVCLKRIGQSARKLLRHHSCPYIYINVLDLVSEIQQSAQ